MKTVKVQQLSAESFKKYGSYAALINPDAESTGPKDATICFYRDMVQQELFGVNPSFSTCRMKKRPLIIDAGEYHNHTCEVCMPLTGDSLVWVAPADCSDHVPTDKIEVFFVPRGTILNVRPGVWHHAAFALDDVLDVMIVLPERAYINDCICYAIPEADQVQIEY